MASTIQIYDPAAPLVRAAATPTAKRLDTLAGKIVGFIDNTKPNFDHLVDELAEVLVARHGVKNVLKRGKRVQSIPAPQAVIDELTRECDLVITGSGD